MEINSYDVKETVKLKFYFSPINCLRPLILGLKYFSEMVCYPKVGRLEEDWKARGRLKAKERYCRRAKGRLEGRRLEKEWKA